MKYVIALFLALPCVATAQVVDYAWLGVPCPSLLNCDTGCTACNRPVNESAQFIGNDVGWLGVDVCPHPVILGDNALLTYGWPSIPDEEHMTILTGIAFSPTHIDSLLIRHTASPDGPQRLQVRFGINESMPQEVIADVAVPESFDQTVLCDLGDVAPGGSMVYGFFSIILQAYEGDGGNWQLDAVRIVGSPALSSGTADLHLPAQQSALQRFDALGRPVLDRRSVRFYLDRSKRVVIE